MVCYTTLAELYHVLARDPMSTASSSQKFQNECSDALMKVASMATLLEVEDVRLADPFLGVNLIPQYPLETS